MATNVTFNSVTYAVPAVGDSQWGDNVSNYLIAISTGCLQKSGGAFTLNAEVDFGGFFGLKSLYVKSKATNPSSAGIFRLGTTEAIGWRKNDNSGDLLLATNTSDELLYNGVKLPRSGEIVNADISTLAAISLSKLAALTADRVLVSDVSGVISASSTTTTTLGYLDVSQSLTTLLSGKEPTITQLPISKGGTNSTTALNNNRVMQSSVGAIIEAAAITAARALISDANGIPTHSTVTDVELGYLSGVTSAIQTQLSGKEPTITTLSVAKGGTNSSNALNNNRIMQSSGGAIVEGAAITANRALISDSNGIPTHSSVTDTELGYVSGVTSSIQTQLGNKAGLVSPAFTTPDIGAATGASLVVGTTPSLDASAALEVDSTTKGFLPPRMTQTQRDAIGTPATGLTIFNTDTNKVNVYNGASWGEVGSGQGGINYISDNDGSVLGAWATYADAAGTSPVDGTGGSPSVTFVTSSSSAMRGNSNFLFAHDNVNRQGQGFSYLCSIDPSDRGKVIRFNFEYLIASGTYADGDLTVWFYDLTNGQVIQGAPTSILNSSLIERYQSEVQVPITCAQMRVIVHVTTTTATAYTMRFENFSFGPSEKLYSGIQTDWVDFPSVAAGTLIKATTTSPTFGTVSLNKAQYRRMGQNLEIMWDYRHTTAGAAGSGAYLFDISQLGLSIDTSKVTATTGIAADNASLASSNVGTAELLSLGLAYSVLTVHPYNSTQLKFSAVPDGTAVFNIWSSTFGNFSSANVSVTMRASVPIVGWSSSSQVVSDDYTGRTVAFFATRSFTAPLFPITTSLQIVTGYTSNIDTVGGLNASTGIYTAKTAGIYQFEAKACSNIGAPTQLVGQFYKNGVATGYNFSTTSSANFPNLVGFITLELKAGDTVAFWLRNSVPGDSAGDIIFSGRKLDGPSQVLASETVSASYYVSANTAATGLTTVINFDGKFWDTHGCVTTGASPNWKATAPITGKYQLSLAAIASISNNWVVRHYSSTGSLLISKFICSSGNGIIGGGSNDFDMKAGEYLQILVEATDTVRGGNPSPNFIYLSTMVFKKVGK